MSAERQEHISAAKSLAESGEIAIGNSIKGAILSTSDGALYALKHSRYRFALNNELTFGDYRKSDLVSIGYQIEPLPTENETVNTVSKWLNTLRQGELPQYSTVGIEVEATCYDQKGNTETPYFDGFTPTDSKHPELIAFTLETATKENGNGLAKNPVEVSSALSSAVLEGYKIASYKNLQLAYSSVAESGSGNSAIITPHPYLQSFAPLVIDFTLDSKARIPEEVFETYLKAGVNVLDQMQQGVLNWPVNALHVHTGMPQKEGLVDTRAAHASGLIRLTEFSKVASFMLYNTKHLYGIDLELKDVRSIIRRLVASSHDGSIPFDTNTLVSQAFDQLENGKIHSLPRYPDTGQHDRIRFRMDGDKKTIESIDASMCPDLRLVLTWASFNQISDAIALDALNEVGGNVSFVIPYLKMKWGNLFTTIPTLGKNSSYEQDLSFNKYGYDSMSTPGRETYRDQLTLIGKILSFYGQKYPALQLQSKIVSHSIAMQTQQHIPEKGLACYLGTENGYYQTNGLNRGLITDYKNINPIELVSVQSVGTRLQAEALQKVRDEKDLCEFMGIK